MKQGINIRNSTGEVQIDGTLNNYYLYQTGTQSFSVPGGITTGDAYVGYQTVVSPPEPYIDSAFIWGIKFSSDDWYIPHGSHFVQDDFYKLGVVCEQGETVSVPYAIWDEPRAKRIPPVEDYGIEVYSYSGNGGRTTGFTSADKYLRYINTYTAECPIGTSGTLGSSTYISVEDAENHYFMVSPVSYVDDYYIILGGSVINYFYMTMCKIQTPNILRFSPRLYQTRNQVGPDSGRKVWTTYKILKVHEFAIEG